MAENAGIEPRQTYCGVLYASGHRSVSASAFANRKGSSPPGRCNRRAESGRKSGRKDALQASGRWAIKKGGMPVPGGRANFDYRRRRRCEANQDNRDQLDHDGHDRVHDGAQGAVVGIAVGRMNVRHLDYEQKRKQNQAYHRRYPESARLWVSICSGICPESCQMRALREIVHGTTANQKS